MRTRIIITGATSGIGLETMWALADKDYEVILACRDIKKAQDMKDRLALQNTEAYLHVHHLDLSSLKSIKTFAQSMYKNYDSVDILFNNAGVYSESKTYTKEGFEQTLGVNFIGTYYLTALLKDLISKGNNPQIINVNSRSALIGNFSYKPGIFENHPHGIRAYAASKYLQIITTKYLSDDYLKSGIVISLIHPGDVATNIWNGEKLPVKMLGHIKKKFMLTPKEGAEAGLYLIKNRPQKAGGFYELRGKEIEFKKYDPDKAKSILDEVNKILDYKISSFKI